MFAANVLGRMPARATIALWWAFGLGISYIAATSIDLWTKLRSPVGCLALVAAVALGSLHASSGVCLRRWLSGAEFKLGTAALLATGGVAVGVAPRIWGGHGHDTFVIVSSVVGWQSLSVAVAMATAVSSSAYPVRARGLSIVTSTLCVCSALVVLAFGGVLSPGALGSLGTDPASYSGCSLKAVRRLTDFDFDGHSNLFGGTDCAPLNAGIHPGVRDVPGNGIDENCNGRDASQKREEENAQPPSEGREAHSVVVITVDSLAADRMSLYGGPNPTTPNIDAWAERHAVVFDNAFTSGAWTSIALPSMFRGVYPRRLEWAPVLETDRYRLITSRSQLGEGERVRKHFALPLREPRRTFFEIIRERGVGGWSSQLLWTTDRRSGLHQRANSHPRRTHTFASRLSPRIERTTRP